MAEGWTRHLRGDEFEPFSAGTEPKRIDPRAFSVMAEQEALSHYRRVRDEIRALVEGMPHSLEALGQKT